MFLVNNRVVRIKRNICNEVIQGLFLNLEMSELRKLITLVTPETESGPFKFDGGSFQDNLTERL